ncbi:hypothetical protein BV917_12355 [Leptospira santarosai serovar Guaricura]|nr:hypothetical protein BV917_12355 [Leptospira santarosai serovar Guaricura]
MSKIVVLDFIEVPFNCWKRNSSRKSRSFRVYRFSNGLYRGKTPREFQLFEQIHSIYRRSNTNFKVRIF